MSPTHRSPMTRVVVASSAGTVFEFYDFFLYGSLVTFFGALFFPPGNETAALLASLAAFGAGFAIRPLGSLLFGRLGDRVGRKQTFLITIVLMGLSTALVGLIPTFEVIGWWAPALLVALRLIQGLALGGEFGGAAIYVAEHSDPARRGYFTSWIQTTATLGLVLSLLVILGCRYTLGEEAFREWGWRIPFLVSVILLGLSVYIRLQIAESPLFEKLKREGGLANAPIRETLLGAEHRKPMAAALVVAAGMALSWYTAQFYSLVFLQTALLIDNATASVLIVGALLIGMGTFLLAGTLADRIGRRPVILTGMLISAVSIMPVYSGLLAVGNPTLATVQTTAPVSVYAVPTRFDPFASAAELDEATRARDYLAKRGISYANAAPVDEAALIITANETRIVGFDRERLQQALIDAGYPDTSAVTRLESLADLDVTHLNLVGLILIMIVGAGFTCGPGATFLAEVFPTRIRYTALSVPYHLTSAWFGGFMPLTAAWLVARSGDVLAGLWYPVAVMGTAFVLALWVVPETRGRSL
ncbi:MAG: MFS transporter [Gammaproteobacteria bacterium]